MTAPRTVLRTEYRPPDYLVDAVELQVELFDDRALVRAALAVHRRPGSQPGRPLVLDGRELTLLSLAMDGEPLPAAAFTVSDQGLTIHSPPERFRLAVENEIHPQDNTALEGLYRSGKIFCTQCEAEGFRRITYFLDRPDVLARYTTTIIADQRRCPVLLANGNLAEQGELGQGRHFATWHDPFPKPCYLFALVAGDLARVTDRFRTRSGREVVLEVYVEQHNRDKCAHALWSLKQAMAWDEQTFGLEYDLDRYMIVAVDDFNMGAMENKGLNIFNSKYVLARSDTATDDDHEAILEVVAHEYFHNWTGNRVTCRDWFQLSLKEGLTVFRDQWFTQDMLSPPVKRIQDVTRLRTHQFPEDAGPMAHPVRPDSYIQINNFYTVTVYEKGAELIRMLHTLLGEAAFKKGLDLYLHRHDGQAATIEDFVGAMAEAGGRRLDQFIRWYSQAGTPELKVRGSWDDRNGEYRLRVSQSCPPTPGQPEKKPFHIPLVAGLLAPDGRELPLTLAGEAAAGPVQRLLEIRKPEEEFVFTGLEERPLPSLLRGFSAPVKLFYDYSDQELAFLLTHDHDPFCRWEAGQQLACRVMLQLVRAHQQGGEVAVPGEFVRTIGELLAAPKTEDPSYLALLCTLPSEKYLGEQLTVIDVEAVHLARQRTGQELARQLRSQWEKLYAQYRDREPYRYQVARAGRRRLKNRALGYLGLLEDRQARQLCLAQFETADNLTDQMAALKVLVHGGAAEADDALATFERNWRNEPLVLDKWFAIQATAPLDRTLERVRKLMAHPGFRLTNPNRVRALLGSFASGNPVCFHHPSGEGYALVAEQILALDGKNPQVAARLAGAFCRWRRYDSRRQALMRGHLERLAARKLSPDLYEVVSKSLAA